MASDIDSAVLEERLNGIDKVLREGLSRIETSLLSMDNRLRVLETSTAKDVAIQGQKLQELEGQVDAHDKTLKEHGEFITRLRPLLTAITWVAITFGGLIVALIWAILTHQVQIVR